MPKTGSSKTTPALMVQGTGSDVGKSLLVAGICRAFTRRGLKVRPFKPQNMSNNAAVTTDGGEIGRAQALQARACNTHPVTAMNPVLLKPESDTGAQLVVRGRAKGRVEPGDFRDFKKTLMPEVAKAFDELCLGADLVLVEGAGSPAETNLRVGDIANMGFAGATGVGVVLVGDVEKGGVIASLVGTHALLEPSERELVKGFIVNKFRGDLSLFDGAAREITACTGWPGLGTVGWFDGARILPKEDSASIQRWAESGDGKKGVIKIAVLKTPRISNFDDLDPMMNEDDVEMIMLDAGDAVPGDVDVLIIAGSKSVIADLRYIKQQGWDTDIIALYRRGGRVLGICGGYQMLGRRIKDPDGVEGPGADEEPGLGLLDIETVLTGDKTLELVSGETVDGTQKVFGYEMHMGLSEGPGRTSPWFRLGDGRAEGAVSDDGLVSGTYLHGLFVDDGFRHHFLAATASGRNGGKNFDAAIDEALDELAAQLEAELDLDAILEIAKDRY